MVGEIATTREIGENFKAANVPANIEDVQPLLGSSFFHRYVVILNTSSKDLILSPLKYEYPNSQSFPIKFGLNNLNELIINFVWETEELKHTDIQIGQKVLSIDNKVFKKLSNADLCELKNYLKEVSKIKITIQMESEPKELELFKSIN